MYSPRTDLASEAHALWRESAGETTQLPGVAAREYYRGEIAVTHVEILDDEGAHALGKPIGHYVTVALPELSGAQQLRQAAEAAAGELRAMLPDCNSEGGALVVGLGNRAITPDAVGPETVDRLLVTRHLRERLPEEYGRLRPVSALIPGVLGTTGIESAEILRGVVDRVRPEVVIVVDALASRSIDRLCRSLQIADTGIVPGSGVGNARAAMNRETLGVPVIAVGIPTVVDAATMLLELAEQTGAPRPDEPSVRRYAGDMIVTPREIDQSIRDIAQVTALTINHALQENLSMEDIIAKEG